MDLALNQHGSASHRPQAYLFVFLACAVAYLSATRLFLFGATPVAAARIKNLRGNRSSGERLFLLLSIRVFGIVGFLSALLTLAFYLHTFTSVWCFFAALLSGMVFLHFFLERRRTA